MKNLLLFVMVAVTSGLIGCTTTSPTAPASKTLQIKISNISDQLVALSSATFGTAPTAPGHSISFSFLAAKGAKFSFAAMFGKSSDWFYALPDTGISLWTNGIELSGDITSLVSLWDAGTKLNQPIDSAKPAIADTSSIIRKITTTAYPTDSIMRVTIVPKTLDAINDSFTVTISVLATSPTSVSPGIWALHSAGKPLYASGIADKGNGLKLLAETGNPASLAAWITPLLGVSTPLSPILYVVSGNNGVIFDSASATHNGLRYLAEDGNAAPLKDSLTAKGFSPMIQGTGVLLPGTSTSLTITVQQGQKLFFASMFGQSNDMFFTTRSHGLEVFPTGGNALTGDVTNLIQLLDAGTEVNEFPGFGPNQAARQLAPGMGIRESGVVKAIDDGYVYGRVDKLISMTITAQ